MGRAGPTDREFFSRLCIQAPGNICNHSSPHCASSLSRFYGFTPLWILYSSSGLPCYCTAVLVSCAFPFRRFPLSWRLLSLPASAPSAASSSSSPHGRPRPWLAALVCKRGTGLGGPAATRGGHLCVQLSSRGCWLDWSALGVNLA